MSLSLLISNGISASFTNTGFLIAIGVLACILGAEIAGICVLISKLLRARRAKYEDQQMSDGASNNSIYRNYAAGAVMLFGAIPQSSVTALLVLAVATAVAAVIFVVLLIALRISGYDFASAAWHRELEARKERAAQRADEPAPELPEEQTEETAIDEVEPIGDGEDQSQYAYTESEEDEETSAFSALDEVREDEPVAMVAPAEPIAQSAAEVLPAEKEPVFADGTRPYKVVEKVVTETYKEVYKEAPAASATQTAQSNPAADAVMEKLADFLDYELQKRKDAEKAEADSEEDKKSASVTAFAQSEMLIDEDEDDDDADDSEEDDETEALDGGNRSEDDEDRDDEENDTDGDRFTGNERIIGFDEETGCYIVAHYRKSFEAKLIQARPNIKKYYSELKNALLSYKGTKNRISWTADSFHNGRTQIAKINVKTRILELYLALDPASLEGTVYRGKDVGSKKKYADTPFQYKLRTPRKFKWALELIQRTCEEHGLSPIDIEHVDYEQQYPFETTESLVERKLIKEYIRQEKPATSFELAPDHVPSVPNEDESVIPANANFSWEFDNDVMEEKEPEPIEEIEVPQEEEPVEEAPAVTEPEEIPAPQPQASVTRETVKITEMRYTERYYANAEPTFEQVITTTEPIEAVGVEVDTTENEDVRADQGIEPEEVYAQEPSDTDEALAEQEPDAVETVDIWDEPSEISVEEIEETEATDDAEESDSVDETADELFFADQPKDEQVWETDNDGADEADELSFEEDSEQELVADEPEDDVYEDVTEEEDGTDSTVYEEDGETEEQIVSEPEPKRIVNTSVAVLDICSVEPHFPPNAVINLDTLKAKGLILPAATVLKIYAGGEMTKAFTVEANHFTIEAIKAISDADGDAVMVR